MPQSPTHTAVEEKHPTAAYDPTHDLADQIEHNMTNHTPTPQRIEDIETLRFYAKDFGHAINRLAPHSRERSLAMTKLEEALMFAVASIARE